MAIDFTVKEAKQLIDRHKVLLSSLEYIASKAGRLEADIRRSANELVVRASLNRMIIDDCARPTDVLPRTPEVERLVYNLYKYRIARTAFETARTFQEYAATSVRKNIASLNPGLAGLSWFFGGKRAKENATQAYQELTRNLSESYGQMIPYLVSEIDSIANMAVDTAWGAFIADPIPFADTTDNLCADVFRSNRNNPFSTQLIRLAMMEQRVTKCRADTGREKQKSRILPKR